MTKQKNRKEVKGLVIKIILILACSISGYAISYHSFSDPFLVLKSFAGFIVGLFIALIVIQIEKEIDKIIIVNNLFENVNTSNL